MGRKLEWLPGRWVCRKAGQEQCPIRHSTRQEALTCYSMYCSYHSLRKRFSYLEVNRMPLANDDDKIKSSTRSSTKLKLRNLPEGNLNEDLHALAGDISNNDATPTNKPADSGQSNAKGQKKKRKNVKGEMNECSILDNQRSTLSNASMNMSSTAKLVAKETSRSSVQTSLSSDAKTLGSSKTVNSPTLHNGCPSRGGKQKLVTSETIISGVAAEVQLLEQQQEQQQQSQQQHMQPVVKPLMQSQRSPNSGPKSSLKKQQHQETVGPSEQRPVKAKQSKLPLKQPELSNNPNQSQMKQQQEQQSKQRDKQEQQSHQQARQSKQLNSIHDGCNSNEKTSSSSSSPDNGLSTMPPDGANVVGEKTRTSASNKLAFVVPGREDGVSKTSISSAKQIVIPQGRVKSTTGATTTSTATKTTNEQTTNSADNRNIIYLSDRARLAAVAALVADAVPFRLPVCAGRAESRAAATATMAKTTSLAVDKSSS